MPNTTLQGESLTVETLGLMVSTQTSLDDDESIRYAEADNGLQRTAELALRLHGWPAGGIVGVIPQIAEMAAAGQIVVHGTLSGNEKVDAATLSAKPSAYWLTETDAQRVLTALCPTVRLYALTEAAACVAKRVHPKDYIAEEALKASLAIDMREAVEHGELPENHRRKDGEVMVNECAVDEWLARERRSYRLGIVAQSEHEQIEMKEAGRLLISDVAERLSGETSIEVSRWEEILIQQVKIGNLPLKNPRNLVDSLPYAVPKNLRTFYDRLDVADVNKLLDASPDWKVIFRFRVEKAEVIESQTTSAEVAPATAPQNVEGQTTNLTRKPAWVEKVIPLAKKFVSEWKSAEAPTVNGNIAAAVTSQAKKEGVTNSRGKALTKETIQREALQGAKIQKTALGDWEISFGD